MIGGLKTVHLAWVNKIAAIGCTWLFVYESSITYEGRMNAATGYTIHTVPVLKDRILKQVEKLFSWT